MHDLPTEWSALCALVFLLGLKHGFDADHLATIDGLTRFNARHRRPFARYCGALFSLGHGLVVVAIAIAVGLISEKWDAPEWLELSGAWVSIGFLTVLGVVNLAAVLAAAPDEVVAPVGLKGRLLGGLNAARRPWTVALVGALFALSFDTVSQAALFALTAAQFGGVWHAIFLGLLFVLGMLVTDGVNGLWISRLIARADQLACIASRVMGLAVSAVSLLVAALGAAKLASPAFDQWTEGRELVFGAFVVAVIATSFVAAVLWHAGGRGRPSPQHFTCLERSRRTRESGGGSRTPRGVQRPVPGETTFTRGSVARPVPALGLRGFLVGRNGRRFDLQRFDGAVERRCEPRHDRLGAHQLQLVLVADLVGEGRTGRHLQLLFCSAGLHIGTPWSEL